MNEKLQTLNSGSDYIGKKCIRCGKELAENDQVVCCPRCHQIHHVECWKDNGGCARRGCPQVAKTITSERPKGDGPPPPMSLKQILAIVGIIVVVIIATVVWPKPPDPAAGRTKIYVLVEASLDEQSALESLVSDFNNSNEEIYIELQTSVASMIENQLIVRMGAGDAPDIFSLPYDRFETMLDQIGAMYQLGGESNPIYGVQHPSQLRVLCVFVYTEHPTEAITVLRYLLSEMPQQDLTELKEQAHILDPEYMTDIDTFLSIPD